MKKLFLFSLVLLWCSSAGAVSLIKVVAMVNNDVVTSYQLDKKLATAMAADTSHNQLSQEEHHALKLKILDALIEDLLVKQRVQELGLTISDQELNSAIKDVQRQNKLNEEQLKSALQAQGMSFADYRQNLRKEMLRYRLISREVRSKVEVTKQQIREYFKAHEEDYKLQPTLRLGRISYPLSDKADDSTREKLMQQAQIIRQQLLGGKPFIEALKTLPGEVDGGDMGTVVETEMNQKLRDIVRDLKVGQVSEPKKVLGSIQIFQVLERTPGSAELTDEVSQAIEKILVTQNSEKRFAEWKKELRKNATIDIRL